MSLPEHPAEHPSSGDSAPVAATPSATRLQRVRNLQQQVLGMSLGTAAACSGETSGESDGWVSSGCPTLDRYLPEGTGFRRGSLVEWFVTGPGSGAGTLALLVARQACAGHGALLIVDPLGEFYPPAAAACGLDLQRLVVIRPRNSRDALWAWDQALRCPAVKAVWGSLEDLEDRWFRRFQLAAEQSGCLGLLLRPAKYRGDPSWSEVQLAVSAHRAGSPGAESPVVASPVAEGVQGRGAVVEQERWIRVEVVRVRRALAAGWSARCGQAVVDLKLEEHHGHLQVSEASNHETPALHLVSQLADPALARHASRA